MTGMIIGTALNHLYSLTAALNATGNLFPYGDTGEESEASAESGESEVDSGKGEMKVKTFVNGNFVLVGYSSDEAITRFGVGETQTWAFNIAGINNSGFRWYCHHSKR